MMLGFWTAGLAALGAASVWDRSLRAVYRRESRADELQFVRSGNPRWRLALARYRPRGDAASPPRKHPVILCHGLGASAQIFDLTERISLATFLARRGYDVWALDLRGHGDSDAVSRLAGRRWGWTFDDYVKQDATAAIEAVLERTGSSSLHWIGHSMGGLALYTYLALGGSAKIRSGITLGSSLDYSHSASDFKRLLRLRWLAGLIPMLPLGLVSRWSAPLCGWLRTPHELFLLWPSNTERRDIRRLMATNYYNVSARVLRQLASAMLPSGLHSADGKTCYLDALPKATAPVLAVAADEDRQCPPDASKATLDALGSLSKKFVTLGPKSGQADHYGHCDIVMGKRAPQEVYPLLADWLDQHD